MWLEFTAILVCIALIIALAALAVGVALKVVWAAWRAGALLHGRLRRSLRGLTPDARRGALCVGASAAAAALMLYQLASGEPSAPAEPTLAAVLSAAAVLYLVTDRRRPG